MVYSYYEYKYIVPNTQLAYVLSLLDGFYSTTDPFAQSRVSSLYFDSPDRKSYIECSSGSLSKRKFRLRYYDGDTQTATLQVKEKFLLAVRKYKTPLSSISLDRWPNLNLERASSALRIAALASQYGSLEPSVTIDYLRNRYRCADMRITLDQNISASANANSQLSARRNFYKSTAMLPFNILELKSTTERPYLPFLGLVNLEQASFSKYYAANRMLEGADDFMNKYE